MAELGTQGGAPLLVDVAQGPTGPVVTLTGELDLSNVDSVQGVIEPLIESKPDRLIFDVGELGFIDSSGIAMLLRALPRVGTIVIRHPSNVVRRVLETTGVSNILEFEL